MKNYVSRIPLGNGKFAYEQEPTLIDPARQEVQRIRKLWTPPKHFFHVQKGGHVAAAKQHLENSYFAQIDLRRFFQQVTKNRLIKRLTKIGYSALDADALAVASTVKMSSAFRVPYGFVQSSMLASLDLDHSALGNEIRHLLAADCTVTVYVDDIIVSANDRDRCVAAEAQLREAAEKSNYLINEDKSSAVGKTLRAFNLDISNRDMRVCKDRMMEFEEAIARAGDSPESVAVLAYVLSVNVEQAKVLYNSFRKKLVSADKMMAPYI